MACMANASLRTLAARLRWAREQAGVTQAELARLCGWDEKTGQTRISHYETGRTPKIDPEDLAAISSGLRRRGVGVATRAWLQYGEPGESVNENVGPGPDIHRWVPEITSITAGEYAEPPEPPYPPKEVVDWHPYGRRTKARIVAMRVDGHSMTSPHGKSYPHGSVIYVNLDLRSPTNGQRVVARLSHEDKTTFKQFVDEDGKRWLKPLNDSYPSLYDPFSVVGTVVGKWEDE